MNSLPPQDRPRVRSRPVRVWRALRLRYLLSFLIVSSLAGAWWWHRRDDPKIYVEQALDIMQRSSLRRKTIDWPAFRRAVRDGARTAKTRRDTYEALRAALHNLGDHHSFLHAPSAFTAGIFPGAENVRRPQPSGAMVGRIAYISVPGNAIGVSAANNEFGHAIQRLVVQLDAQDPTGWIVDLRDNTGGNMWPMLAGLGPILGEGDAGRFVVEKLEAIWWYRAGAAGIGTSTLAKAGDAPYRLRRPGAPVAVLTGPRTASSGEAMVVAFRGRPETRSFGAATCGLSTGNSRFRLSDGAELYLTTSVYADRTGKTYGGVIEPDEAVEATPGKGTGDVVRDPVIAAAVVWLKTREPKLH